MKQLLAFVSCIFVLASPLSLADTKLINLPGPDDLPEFKPIAPPKRTEFSDIPQSHWAYSQVKRLAEIGLVEGDAQGRFNGEAPLKRAEFAIVLDRLNSRRISPLTIPEWANEQKSYFTRYEFAVAMRRVSHFIVPRMAPLADSEPPVALNEFRDIPQSHWALLAANQLAGLGILEGDSQGRFNGNALLTRYEFALILMRYHL